MNHNDVLRRLRYALDQSDAQVMGLVRLGGLEVRQEELASYQAKDTDPAFVPCPDRVLAAFLDGLVTHRRGPRDPALPPRPPDPRLDNNLILKKLRIALELQEKDMLAVLALGGMQVTASELGALFRSEGHKHFRSCGDQLLRNFLNGLTDRLRGAQP
jgi:uncharacterized protein YehS (DUF1456 family)